MNEGSYVGHAPKVLIKPIAETKADENPEAARYRQMWAHKDYRETAPGEDVCWKFLGIAKPPRDAECIDFGCGTGRGALMLALLGNLRMTMLDFADNCLDEDVRKACELQRERINFKIADLVKGSPVTAPYGYCTDVMEHVRPEDVPAVLTNILAAAQHTFFSISTVPDHFGPIVLGEPLHLTVEPLSWWTAAITNAGGVVHWAEEYEGGCFIYCSGWKDADDIIKTGTLNVDLDTINENIRRNVEDGWAHATPYDRQDREVILLGGGPSLLKHVEEIKKLRAEGAALITTNGTYNWALEQGLAPSAQIVVDAREFNGRFVKPVVPNCLYFMASQVHPKTLEGLPRDRTFLWHTGVTPENERLIRERTKHFFPVPGGCTVVLRAIPLLRMLGFWRLHIFGFDSCVQRSDANHHAYSQPENDDEHLFPVACGGRQFWCAPWMVSQASEFRGLVKSLGDEVEMAVYGDGLIAQIVETGASFSTLEEA